MVTCIDFFFWMGAKHSSPKTTNLNCDPPTSSTQEATDLTSFDAAALPPELRKLILSFCTIEMVANRLPLFRMAPLPGETAAAIREELLASRFFKFGTWEIFIHRGQIFVLNVHNREGAVFMFRPRDSAPPCINVQCMASTIRHFENGYLPEQPPLVEIPNEKSVRHRPRNGMASEGIFGAYLFTAVPFGERHLRISCDQIPVYFFCNEHSNGWALLLWKDSAIPEMPKSPHFEEEGKGKVTVWSSSVVIPAAEFGHPYPRLDPKEVIA
ncbi:hypothetical protein PAPYR_5957 [Paratrimastix pyriformis]|uniref:Uncharacterized protein n=1 Tax=Paratrimastix pyriformis TaxID=342808 RepID=A0ABQ8UKP7_9EUKA|nr:hypothetical protein PAPYR_5957 [Paratrimastix pyriformis]